MDCRETACDERGCTDEPWEGHAVPICEDNCVLTVEGDVPINGEDGVPISEEDGVPIGQEEGVPIGVPIGNCEVMEEITLSESCDHAKFCVEDGTDAMIVGRFNKTTRKTWKE